MTFLPYWGDFSSMVVLEQITTVRNNYVVSNAMCKFPWVFHIVSQVLKVGNETSQGFETSRTPVGRGFDRKTSWA